MALLAAALLAGALLAALTLTVASAQAAFPGDNGRIACSGPLATEIPTPTPTGQSRLEIFDINPDGTGERRLTENTNSDFQPKYTADGTRIAFVRDNQVWTMNADGTGATQLTTAGTNTPGSWSPDGSKIVFTSTRDTTGGSRFEVYVMNADGSAQTRLTENAVSDSLPAWSPDGSKILFQSGRAGNPNLFTMNPDGSAVTQLTNEPSEESGPAWSPDGTQIVFHSDRLSFGTGRPSPNRNLEIYRMSASGGPATRLTFSDATDPTNANDLTGYDIFPAWSPAGDRIVFHSGRAPEFRDSGQAPFIGQWEVFTIDAVNGEGPGGDIRRLTNRAGNDERCDWQPIPRAAQVDQTPPGQQPTTGQQSEYPFCPGSTNTIVGSGGDDVLEGTPLSDLILALAGDDVAEGESGDDCLFMGAGRDRGNGGEGSDRLFGEEGNDRLGGNDGNDRIDGGAGRDRISGQDGNDRLLGSAAGDRISGGNGRDRIAGGSGRDIVSAGGAVDRANGGGGADRLFGGPQNDVLRGGSGGDRLRGDTGRDRLVGGRGNDRIVSRDRFRDRVNCGSGRDRVLADPRDRVMANCEVVVRRS